MSETENIINRKIQAAQVLGLTVERSYQEIGDSFFIVFKVKKEENVVKTFTIEKNKVELLATYNQQISLIQTQITYIQEQIDAINAI